MSAQQNKWPQYLDRFCALLGAFFPTALIMGNAAFEATVALVGLGWISRLVITSDNPFPRLLKHPLFLPWLAWYACIIISLVYNGAGHKGWMHDIVIIRHILFAFALIDISARLPVARYLIYGLAGGVLWTAANTGSAYLFGYDFLGKPLELYNKKINMTGRIAGLTAFTFPFFLGWALFDSRLSLKRKRIIFIIGFLSLVILIQTLIRTTILASLSGIFFILLFYIWKNFSKKMAVFIACGLIISGAFLIFQITHLITPGNTGFYSIFDRIYIWQVAVTFWKENPFLGVGISSFQDKYKETAPFVAAIFAPPLDRPYAIEATHSHNIILMLLSCTGILGLSSFIWLFIKTIQHLIKEHSGYKFALIAWVVVFLVNGITGYNIYHSWYLALFSFFIVLIVAKKDSGYA